MVPKILTFGAGQNGKNFVFGSDFMTYSAPFYKWCRFTYGAVTVVREQGQTKNKYRYAEKKIDKMKHLNRILVSG